MKNHEPQTFLLRWNPAISSFTLDAYIEHLRHLGTRFQMDWSVYQWENARKGDRFFMLREGDGENPGIVFRGTFVSDPYPGRDWAGTTRVRYYVDIDCFGCADPDKLPVIPTEALDQTAPEYNWHRGHSGELLSPELAQTLEDLWETFAPGSIPDENSFDPDPDRGINLITDDIRNTLSKFIGGYQATLADGPDGLLFSNQQADVQIRAVAFVDRRGTVQITHLYPYVVNNRQTAEFQITGIQPLGNRKEAVVTISNGVATFRIQAADYLANKDKYVIGHTHMFALSALAIDCKTVPEEELTIEMGPEWAEENGMPLPEGEDKIVFSLDKMTACFQTMDQVPFVAEFQSPTQSRGRKINKYDKEAYILEIALNIGDSGDPAQDHVKIPLYAATKHFGQKPRPQTPIRGIAFLQGIICEEEKY